MRVVPPASSKAMPVGLLSLQVSALVASALLLLATCFVTNALPVPYGKLGAMDAAPKRGPGNGNIPEVTCDPDDPAKCTCEGMPIGPDTYQPPPYMVPKAKSLYELTADYGGAPTELSYFAGNVTMVVNVASA